MKTTLMQPDSCPYCQYTLDAASSLDGDHQPSPGDITMCARCSGFLEYGQDLKVHALSQEIFDSLPTETKQILLDAAERLVSIRSRSRQPQ